MRSPRHQKKTIAHRKRVPCNILILTCSIGHGHVAVARAVIDALYRLNGNGMKVEIVDFVTTLKNIATSATKKIYLNSLKLSPKIYEFIFSHTLDTHWPLKLLNSISSPFMQHKLLSLIREKNPQVLVSTFPIWDLLIKKIWKNYSKGLGKHFPFVSIVTDSISIHTMWTMGNPDFFIVPNEDTKISLQNFGIPEQKIKLFGYPVARCFFKQPSAVDFQKQWNLSPKRKTLLLILSTGIRWTKVKQIVAAIHQSTLKNLQLIIVVSGKERWRDKLSRVKFPWPTRITGFTAEMHMLIHGADIILTKAGGATVMECIHSKKPMVIIDAIPGQEIGNAMLVQKYNLGVVLNEDGRDFDRAIHYILAHEQLVKKNLAHQQKNHAAEDIARFLLQLIHYN